MIISDRWMKVDEGTKVVDIKRQKGGTLSVTTTSRFCETVCSRHDKLMTYTVKKGQIVQACPVCKKCNPRTHKLSPDIVNLLKQ